ncbi:zinc finger protein 346 [Denticeps clupeoides]|uniref:Zinc finger protein 346 n=1 Tax=Denticeps clupeoides TaxID=299321 RepID=A0AAY4BE16_9TELE|nr:zinc finger protein 346 [Denticeps clupeoides]
MAHDEANGGLPYLLTGPAEVNKLIRENSDLFSDSHCKVCSAVLISESHKLAHYQSKKHANKVRRYVSIHGDSEPAIKKFRPASSDDATGDSSAERYKMCLTCNMTFSSPVMAQSHYQGKVHAKNLKLKSTGFQVPVPPQARSQEQKKPDSASAGVAAQGGPADGNPDRFCPICHASFNNPLMAQQHYVGKRHKKQLTKQRLMETYGPSPAPASTVTGYPCTVCNIELNSVEQYQAHIKGSKHRNQCMKVKGVASALVSTSKDSPSPPKNSQPEYECPSGQDLVQQDWGSFNQDYE